MSGSSKKHIKICGITCTEDAELAIEAGADYLGLIRVESSPRGVTKEQAKKIIEFVNHRVLTVGVFQNPVEQEVLEEVNSLGFHGVQFHGEESPELISEISVPVIKTILLNGSSQQNILDQYQACSNLQYWLFDLPKTENSTLNPLQAFRQIPLLNLHNKRYFLAGKLTPENVREVLTQFECDGVDVASGVEASKGRKDPAKIAAFCQHVHCYEKTVL